MSLKMESKSPSYSQTTMRVPSLRMTGLEVACQLYTGCEVGEVVQRQFYQLFLVPSNW